MHICHQMAQALSHIHSHGVCHFDLKLNNWVVSDDHRVVLIDFGTAKIAGRELDSSLRMKVK